MHGRGCGWQRGTCMAGGVHDRRDSHCSGRYASYCILVSNIAFVNVACHMLTNTRSIRVANTCRMRTKKYFKVFVKVI